MCVRLERASNILMILVLGGEAQARQSDIAS